MEGYESAAKALPDTPGRKPTWLDLAVLRYKVWQGFAENQGAFREFQNAPFGKMVLKYNPVLVNAGGIIVTKTDIECQFEADALVAKIAAVEAPAPSDKEQLMPNLAGQFGSMAREQQEYLRRAELRLVNFHLVYDGTIKTRATIAADIRKSVHSSGDVPREALQVENDAEYGSRYYQLYRAEALAAIGNATRVNSDIVGLGRAGRSNTKSGDINTPIGAR
jgi:hypothetical protein